MPTPSRKPSGAARPRPASAPALRRRVGELEQQVADLQAERERRTEAESILARRTADLVERVKELDCLYSLSTRIDDHESSLGELLQQVVCDLPRAFRGPQAARAQLHWGAEAYQTSDYAPCEARLSADILLRGEAVGFVEVGYLAGEAPDPARPFLDEERKLLHAVAERLGELIELKQAQTEISGYEQRLRFLAAQLSRTEERERRQIAVCLHDRIGQTLAVAKLKLESAAGAEDGPARDAQLEHVGALLKQAIGETRSLTFEISPPVLHELGLKPALHWLAEHFRRQFGLRVLLEVERLESVEEDDLRVMLFRAVCEVLTNVVKHARASRAELRARSTRREVRLTVFDDGVGFDVPAALSAAPDSLGFGLFSIRERLSFAGGRMEIASAPGRGTRVRLIAPLRAGGEEEERP